MPERHELVGPFPPGVDEDEYDRRRRRILWKVPTGLYLVGARAGEERNFMTANLVTQVATEPKLVAVAIENEAHTHRLVERAGAFSLSLIRREDRELVRAFARPALDDPAAHTLAGIAYRDAPVSGLPVLARGYAYLDCAVRERVSLGSHTLFVGEVRDADFGDGGESGEVLRMEDTRMNYGG